MRNRSFYCRREILLCLCRCAATSFSSFPLRGLAEPVLGYVQAQKKVSEPCTIDGVVKQIIIKQLGVKRKEVTPTARLVDDLGVDSLDTVELNLAFEETFEIDIPDEDCDRLTTVGSIIKYIKSRVPNWTPDEPCPSTAGPKTSKPKTVPSTGQPQTAAPKQ